MQISQVVSQNTPPQTPSTDYCLSRLIKKICSIASSIFQWICSLFSSSSPKESPLIPERVQPVPTPPPTVTSTPPASTPPASTPPPITTDETTQTGGEGGTGEILINMAYAATQSAGSALFGFALNSVNTASNALESARASGGELISNLGMLASQSGRTQLYDQYRSAVHAKLANTENMIPFIFNQLIKSLSTGSTVEYLSKLQSKLPLETRELLIESLNLQYSECRELLSIIRNNLTSFISDEEKDQCESTEAKERLYSEKFSDAKILSNILDPIINQLTAYKTTDETVQHLTKLQSELDLKTRELLIEHLDLDKPEHKALLSTIRDNYVGGYISEDEDYEGSSVEASKRLFPETFPLTESLEELRVKYFASLSTDSPKARFNGEISLFTIAEVEHVQQMPGATEWTSRNSEKERLAFRMWSLDHPDLSELSDSDKAFIFTNPFLLNASDSLNFLVNIDISFREKTTPLTHTFYTDAVAAGMITEEMLFDS